MNNEPKTMVNIGGLWVNKSKNGEVYLSGYLNGARLLVFKNNFKEHEKQPDYVMYVTPNQQRQQSSASEFEPPAPSENTDDIPF